MLSPVKKRGLRPKNPLYPNKLLTLGDHIRVKRLDSGLLQKDVARIIQVSTKSIVFWENNRHAPNIQHHPKIMEFLGYCPYEFPKTYGERLRLYRIHQGLSYEKLARILKVDPVSIRHWEARKEPPGKFWQKKISWFMDDG
jgi:DNA-binding XRE family transcriptional regulator